MSPILNSLISWFCFPYYAVLGTYIRETTMRLSPPSKGKLSGQFGTGKPKARLLAVGDSSAAGVGIENTSGTIGVQVAQKLHKQMGETVSWRVCGHNSAVANELRDLVVPNLADAPYTHILIMLGTNDIKNWHTVPRWKKGFGGLLYALRTKFPEAKIYWHQTIDVTQVPALPYSLAWIMNLRVALFNRMGAQLCLERGAVCIPPIPVTIAEGYCKDGFHANELGYSIWADHMLDYFDEEPRTSPAVKEYV